MQNADDRITNLPGYSGKDTMYSGYLPVDAAAGRNLFYWFVESRNSPSTDPLILWMNGGPGCSSLGGGLFSELGPFFPNPNDEGVTLVNNPYSWVNVANVIFLESPAGVGFSYSDTTSDYIVRIRIRLLSGASAGLGIDWSDS